MKVLMREDAETAILTGRDDIVLKGYAESAELAGYIDNLDYSKAQKVKISIKNLSEIVKLARLCDKEQFVTLMVVTDYPVKAMLGGTDMIIAPVVDVL